MNAHVEHRMHLDEFLEEEQKSQRGFGAELDPPVSQSLMSQWVRGETRITLAYALEIERKTKGKVTPQDCADMYKGRGVDRVPALSPQPA